MYVEEINVPYNIMKTKYDKYSKSTLTRGGSRAAATSKMVRFVIIANGWKLPAVNYYYKALHLRCCSSPRSASANFGKGEIEYYLLKRKFETFQVQYEHISLSIYRIGQP